MDCPLPYQIKDDYYIDVNDFAEDFIKFSNTLGIDDLSQMLELLLIGVYWEVYKKDALILSKRSHDVLATLSSLRNKSKMSKDLIDDVRGMLLTKEFSKDNGENDFDLNKYNLTLLFDYLEATGDFVYQLPHLRKYENNISPDFFEKCGQLSEWFFKNSHKYLASYTLGFEDYFTMNDGTHKMKEDIIFFNSPVELYYLNMLGANLMNRIFRSDFQLRKRKTLLLPSCMTISKDKCRAKDTPLGPTCVGCNKNCNVYKIAKDFPHELYLIGHNSDSLKGATKKDLEELGIIGVTCVLNLISGGYQSAGMGIPPQCVLLNHVSCSKHWLSEDCPSTIDVQELSNKI